MVYHQKRQFNSAHPSTTIGFLIREVCRSLFSNTLPKMIRITQYIYILQTYTQNSYSLLTLHIWVLCMNVELLCVCGMRNQKQLPSKAKAVSLGNEGPRVGTIEYLSQIECLVLNPGFGWTR